MSARVIRILARTIFGAESVISVAAFVPRGGMAGNQAQSRPNKKPLAKVSCLVHDTEKKSQIATSYHTILMITPVDIEYELIITPVDIEYELMITRVIPTV